MTLIEILVILAIHYFADFIMQDNYMAQNKWHSNIALIHHTSIYTAVWAIFGVIWVIFHLNEYSSWHFTYFILIIFVFHTIQDWVTSKITHELSIRASANNNWHNFFVVIGFDQLLHYVQLFLTFKLLK